MALSYLFDPNKQFQDKNGVNNVGGYLYVFINDSDDHAPTYCNFTGTLNPERIVLDNNGRAVVIVDELKTYRIEVYDRSGNMLWSQYPVRPTNVIYGDYNVYNADIYGTPDEIDVDVETYVSGVKKFTIKLANAVKTVIGNIQDTISSIVETVSTKADKVQGATAGNLAALDANGNLTDSGKKAADFKTKQTPVASPNPSGYSGLNFIDSLSQNENGEVVLHKNTVQSASTTYKGVVQLQDSVGSTESVTDRAVTPHAVRAAIDSAVSSAYHAAGTKTVAQLTGSLLIAANAGDVYNMTDSGTTTADFVEGAGHPIKAGDNVGVCDVGSGVYKFDLLSGFVDLSNYLTKTGDASDTTSTFTKASSDTSSMTSGSKLSAIFTAISSFFATVASHLSNTSNPHSVTAAQVGLGNVGNFKAVSTVAGQGLNSTEQSNARTNIGAGTYTKDVNGIPKTDLASGVQTSLGLADTALQSSDVDSAMSSTSTNPVQNKVVNSALSGKASSTHTHGNIANDGTLQTTDVSVDSGDKLVVTDASNSNKVARTSVTFDGSTTTKALTQKGTFETFLQSHQDISGKEDKSNKVTAWQSTPDNTHYPSEKLVKDELDARSKTYTITQPAAYKSFLCITDITRWYDETGTQSLSAGYQMVGQWNCWRYGGAYDTIDCFFMLYHLNYRWQLNNPLCFEMATTRPAGKTQVVAYPAILKDERDSANIKYYFGFRIIPEWANTFQFIGRLRDINFDNLIWIEGAGGNSTTLPTGCSLIVTPTEMKWDVDCANTLKTARTIQTNLASTTAASFDGSANVTPGVTGTLPVANGGTGATTKKAAEYAINRDIDPATAAMADDFRIVFSRIGSDQNATNGVFVYRTALTVWNYIKDKISSVLGLTATEYGGNAATATTATTAAGYTSGSALETAINSKLDNTGDASNTTSTFTKNASDTSSMTSGGKLSAIFTAISNVFASFKALAFKDKASYSDLSSGVQSSLDKADSALQAAVEYVTTSSTWQTLETAYNAGKTLVLKVEDGTNWFDEYRLTAVNKSSGSARFIFCGFPTMVNLEGGSVESLEVTEWVCYFDGSTTRWTTNTVDGLELPTKGYVDGKLPASGTTPITETYAINIDGTAVGLYVPRSDGDLNGQYSKNKFNVVEYKNTSLHRPTPNGWYFNLAMCGGDSDFGAQIAPGMTIDRIFWRNRKEGSFGNWREIPSFLGTTGVGSASQPVYVDSEGTVKACGFQVNFGTPIAGANVLNIITA